MSHEEAREVLLRMEIFQKSSPEEQEEAIKELVEKWDKKYGS